MCPICTACENPFHGTSMMATSTACSSRNGRYWRVEGPLELGVIEIARMHAEVVGMHRHGGITEIDDDLDAITLLTRVERQQRVFVQLELIEDALQARIGQRCHD